MKRMILSVSNDKRRGTPARLSSLRKGGVEGGGCGQPGGGGGEEEAESAGRGRGHPRGRVVFLPAQAWARQQNAPAALRSRLSGSWAAGRDAVGRDTGGGRVRKWGRGGRERSWGCPGVRRRGGPETPGRAGPGGSPGPPRRPWRTKKVRAPGSSAPAVARGLGKGRRGREGPRGLGCGRSVAAAARGVAAWGAAKERGGGGAGTFGSGVNGPKFCPPQWEAKVELKVGSEVGREEAVFVCCGGRGDSPRGRAPGGQLMGWEAQFGLEDGGLGAGVHILKVIVFNQMPSLWSAFRGLWILTNTRSGGGGSSLTPKVWKEAGIWG